MEEKVISEHPFCSYRGTMILIKGFENGVTRFCTVYECIKHRAITGQTIQIVDLDRTKTPVKVTACHSE